MTLDECDAEFERIASARTRKAIRAPLARLIAAYPDINLGFGRGSIYWRARLSDDRGFEAEAQMSYPPASIARVGRLNDAGSPRLYLSARKETALAEIGAKEGDYVHLAGFRVLSDKILRVLAVGELSHVQKAGYIRITGVDPNMTIARMVNGYPHDVALTILYIDSYLGSILCDSAAGDGGYVATRTLASLLYRRSKAAVGMFYPSVQTELGLNLALLPGAADALIHGVVSAVVLVKRVLRFGHFDFDVIRTATGVNEHGRYEWQAPESPKSLNVYRLCKEEYDQVSAGRRTLLDLPTHQAIPRDNPKFLRRLLRRFAY